jgi:hypothetical protein
MVRSFYLARTNLDLAQAEVEGAPSDASNIWLPCRGGSWYPVAWSALEHRCRKDYERVSRLYPHDAEKKYET